MTDNPEFKKLSKHLAVFNTTFTKFCDEFGFTFANPTAIGTYPRIRIRRQSDVLQWFDLWMCLDDDGKPYTQFFEEIPYELSAGVSVEYADEPPHGERYQVAWAIWERRAFCLIDPRELYIAMESELPKLDAWTEARLRQEGKRVVYR